MDINKIPKTIHYCWFGPNQISELSKKCIDSWRHYCPEYEIIFWNESTIDMNDEVVIALLNKRQYAFLSDYIRLIAVSKYGGIYLDTDVELIRSLDPLLSNRVFFSTESEGRPNSAVFGGVCGSEVIQYLIQKFRSRILKKKPYLIAPEFLIKYIDINNTEIFYTPVECFFPYNPYNYRNKIPQLLFSDIKLNTYGIHHFASGWKLSLGSRIFKKIFFWI